MQGIHCDLNCCVKEYKGINLSPQEIQFNKDMSKVRECVEWGFGEIINQLAFLDFKKNFKILLQPVAKYYLVATLLLNCKTCMHGNITSSYFDLDLPSVEEYLNN